MRIIILSIALLFCAFSAHSQVLKSAGVWYFLDVDSMTARPAVLPNGTELAYVVGTKKIYYWDRGTSTWTEYSTGGGSSFNRDSIYFDSSIIGSGTVSDPWGVDSTLFATITGVGDSIAAALAGYVEITDTAAMLTNYPTKAEVAANPTTIASGYLATSNGTNLVARNLFDNNTAVSILNSKPFALGQWTTAGRPSSVNGYKGRNTTTGFDEGYFTSQWENYITSIGSLNGQVAVFGSAGKIYGNNNLAWDNVNNRLGVGTFAPNARVDIASANGGASSTLALTQLANNGSALLSYISIDFTVPTSGLIGQFFATANNYANAGVNLAANSTGLLTESTNGMLLLGAAGTNGYISFNTAGYAVANERMRILANGRVGIGTTTPQRQLQVTGETRITDLNTDPPTQIVGADADGDLGAMAISGGLSISSGTLSSTWLKPALEASNVTVSNNSNTLTLTGSNLTMLNQGGFNQFKITGNTDYEGTITQAQKTFTYFTQLDRGNPLLPGQYRLKHQIAHSSLGGGDHVINVTSLDTNTTLIRNFQGSFFGSEKFAQQFSVSTESSVTGFKILKIDAGVTGSLFDIQYTGGSTPFLNSFWANGSVTLSRYGTGIMEAADLSKTQSNYVAGFATDGTLLEIERKRDTTIYIDDADYDFSAAITTAQIASRFNRVIFWMTTTGAAGSDSELTLHTPDVNLMQVEYLIHSVDEAGGFENKIVFGSNNAVDSTNGLVTNYYPAAGDGIHIRAGLRSGVYKYRYSN